MNPPILAVLILVAAGCGPQRGADGFLVNATLSSINYTVEFGGIGPAISLVPGERSEAWDKWPSTLLIERGIVGADPLAYVLDDLPLIAGESMLLVLMNYSLYLIPARRWPSSPPQSEEGVRALSIFTLLPLD